MKVNHVSLLIFLLMLLSCAEKKKHLAFYDDSYLMEDSVATNDPSYGTIVTYNAEDEVIVPFTEKGGVKYLDVTVNREFTVKMILDSGCSSTLISIAEARFLYEKGGLTQDDILGTTQSQIADGTIVENMVINLRELVIGGQIVCSDVTAVVSSNTQAPLLLGNEVLDRAPSYSVDNQNKVIKFRLQ